MDIHQVQQWFSAVLIGQGDLSEKVAHAETLWGLNAETLIKGDERVSRETRMNVYAKGYFLRLLECMQADLPSLYEFWGPQLFDLFGRSYLFQHPSASFSLFDLTAGYADFLDRTKPPKEKIPAENAVHYDIPAELVRLERARLTAILSKGTEGQSVAAPLDFFSFFTGDTTSVQAHPALQLLVQKMPLVEVYRQLMQDETPEIPEYQTSYVAVTRLQFRIQFYQLSDWQHLFLEELKANETPMPVHEIVHRISEKTNKAPGTLLSESALWLPNAIRMGLVC